MANLINEEAKDKAYAVKKKKKLFSSKKRKKFADHIGVLHRLRLEPREYLSLDQAGRDYAVKKHIVSELKPP